MTFHPCGFHSISPVEHRKMPVFRGSQSAGELEACMEVWGETSSWGWTPCAGWRASPRSLAAPWGHGAASSSPLPGQVQLVPLEAGQSERWWHAQFIAFLRRDTGTAWRTGPQSIWSLTAVVITPFRFNYCIKLMNYWLVVHLLGWLFSKECRNGSRGECRVVARGHCRATVLWQQWPPPLSPRSFSLASGISSLSLSPLFYPLFGHF